MADETTDMVLRRTQVTLQLVTVVTGLTTAIGLGWAYNCFDNHCPLYARLKVTETEIGKVQVEPETVWGDDEKCQYSTFLPVVAAIYAVIWFWFFLLLSNWHRVDDQVTATGRKVKLSEPPDIGLLLPTLIFNSILWICVVVSLGYLSVGVQKWCDGFTKSLVDRSCGFAGTAKWKTPIQGSLGYRYLTVALVGNWLLLISVLGTVIVICIRIYRFLSIESKSEERVSRLFGIKSTHEDVEDEEDGARGGIPNPAYEGDAALQAEERGEAKTEGNLLTVAGPDNENTAGQAWGKAMAGVLKKDSKDGEKQVLVMPGQQRTYNTV